MSFEQTQFAVRRYQRRSRLTIQNDHTRSL